MDKTYFDAKATCQSCKIRTKEAGQIVCSYCHENELQPEWIDDDEVIE